MKKRLWDVGAMFLAMVGALLIYPCLFVSSLVYLVCGRYPKWAREFVGFATFWIKSTPDDIPETESIHQGLGLEDC